MCILVPSESVRIVSISYYPVASFSLNQNYSLQYPVCSRWLWSGDYKTPSMLECVHLFIIFLQNLLYLSHLWEIIACDTFAGVEFDL